MSVGAFKTCPVCGKARATTRTGVIKIHRRWTGVMMVRCDGSLKRPVANMRRG